MPTKSTVIALEMTLMTESTPNRLHLTKIKLLISGKL